MRHPIKKKNGDPVNLSLAPVLFLPQPARNQKTNATEHPSQKEQERSERAWGSRTHYWPEIGAGGLTTLGTLTIHQTTACSILAAQTALILTSYRRRYAAIKLQAHGSGSLRRVSAPNPSRHHHQPSHTWCERGKQKDSVGFSPCREPTAPKTGTQLKKDSQKSFNQNQPLAVWVVRLVGVYIITTHTHLLRITLFQPAPRE